MDKLTDAIAGLIALGIKVFIGTISFVLALKVMGVKTIILGD